MADSRRADEAPRMWQTRARRRQRPPRLTLVISSLEMGGAERVMTELANHWASKAGRSRSSTTRQPGPAGLPARPAGHRGPPRASPSLAIADLGHRQQLRRIRVLRRAIQSTRDRGRPVVHGQCPDALATTGSGVPVIVSEHAAHAGAQPAPGGSSGNWPTVEPRSWSCSRRTPWPSCPRHSVAADASSQTRCRASSWLHR